MTSRRLAFGLLLACLALHWAPMLFAQATLDPQSLVGEWVGKWIAAATGGGSGGRGGTQGPYSLVITRVEGDRVFATLDTQGFSGNIRATLSGDRLTFGGEQFQTELAIDGNQMRGTRRGGGIPAREIQLLKKK